MRFYQVVVVAGLLCWGTLSTVLSKVLYQLKGPGRDGHVHHFEKPLATTALMFLAMLCVLPLSLAMSWYERRRRAAKRAAARGDAERPLLSSNGNDSKKEGLPPGASMLKSFALMAVPTMFDLVATTLMNVGLLFVTASVFQMMRGAEMMFSAIYAVGFLHRTLNRYHYTGLVTSAIGITIVGIASLRSGSDVGAFANVNGTQVLIGMTLIVAAQAIQAAQITVEDYLMDSVHMEPLMIVGCEGLWGIAIMAAIVLPAAQFLPGREGQGLHEDTLDTFEMLKNSSVVRNANILQMLAMALYNIFGMFTTDDLGSVARTVLECLRTLWVWVVNLLLFYAPPPVAGVQLGEPWVSPASWLQLAGFVVLVAGTLVYSEGDEVTSEAHQRDAATKGMGQLIKKHRHHLMKSSHTMASVAWTIMAIKGLETRARWKSVATRALEAEQRMMEATRGSEGAQNVGAGQPGYRVDTQGVLL